MAGDWIKMRTNLVDDPRVSRICDLTDQMEATVIGGLYMLWAAGDAHSVDGHMPGLSLRGIDRKTGVQGLGNALIDIGWITEVDGGVTLTRFEDHNGVSAKRRAMEAQRKASQRKPSAPSGEPVRNVSACDADKKRTTCGRVAELEKEKEKDIKTKPPVNPSGFTPPPLEETVVLGGGDKPEPKKADKVRKIVTRPDWITEQVWADYRQLRQAKKAPLSPTAWRNIEAELRRGHQAGHDPNDMLALAVEKGWQGFRLEWYERELLERGQPRASPSANGQNSSSSVKRRFAGTKYEGTPDEDLPDELRPH